MSRNFATDVVSILQSNPSKLLWCGRVNGQNVMELKDAPKHVESREMRRLLHPDCSELSVARVQMGDLKVQLFYDGED